MTRNETREQRNRLLNFGEARTIQRHVVRIALSLWIWLCFLGGSAQSAPYHPSPKDWRDLTMYMIFTDRFADGDPGNNELTPGAQYRPGNPRGIHGGDFKGIEDHLSYIRSLGARAIWITPVYINEPSSAWHGYGAVDFSTISPQLGGLDGLQRLVRAAHHRGIHVIIDVVVNHLGNVAVSDDPGWPRFRPQGEGYRLRWTSPSRMPTPPFNQLGWFHDRGQVQNWMDPVQSVVGQFFTLNDLKTELPEVRDALATAYKELIRLTDCDGFRVDTVRHVEESFWSPWCSAIRNYARTLGKTNFLMFGEVALAEDRVLARFTGPSAATDRAFDSLLDYPLYYALNQVLCEDKPTRLITERFEHLTAPPYGSECLSRMVTFIDNHDQPRFLSPKKATDDVARLRQALVLLYTLPGVPCLYYGTEQGFHGGGDPFNREDMIPVKTAQTATNHFQMRHPLFQYIAQLNKIRSRHPALRTGVQTVLFDQSEGPGLFVFERRSGKDIAVVIINTARESRLLGGVKSALPPGTRFSATLQKSRSWTIGRSGELPAMSIPEQSAEIWIGRL